MNHPYMVEIDKAHCKNTRTVVIGVGNSFDCSVVSLNVVGGVTSYGVKGRYDHREFRAIRLVKYGRQIK